MEVAAADQHLDSKGKKKKNNWEWLKKKKIDSGWKRKEVNKERKIYVKVEEERKTECRKKKKRNRAQK